MLADQLITALPPMVDQPKRRKSSLSISFFSQDSREENKDSVSLDIISHEIRTPLHTMQQSSKSLQKLVTRINKQNEDGLTTKANDYLGYIETSLNRLSTFIRTGQPTDHKNPVQEHPFFSDISLKALVPIEGLEKATKDLQNIYHLLLKSDSAESLPANINILMSQSDDIFNKCKIYLDTLTQLIPAQNTQMINKKNNVCLSPPPEELKILVVDDNKINVLLLENIIKKKKCIADKAYDGIEAVNLFSPGKYHLIFMDITMPKMNGYQAARQIRQIESEAGAPETPIVTLTANTDTRENREKATEAGMNDFLSKPYKYSDIYRLMKKYSPYKDIPSPTSPELDSPPGSPTKNESPRDIDMTSSFSQLSLIGMMGTTTLPINNNIPDNNRTSNHVLTIT